MFTPPQKGERRGGRQKGSLNKSTAEIRALAQSYGPAAIKVAVRLMEQSENEATQLAAAMHILDRGYGKPAQSHEIGNKDGEEFRVSAPTDDRLKAALALLLAKGTDA